MRRNKNLSHAKIYEALNIERNAFLAAKDGNQVNKIIDGLLTYDERLKIGRRILIAKCLRSNIGIDEISHLLRVGKSTIMHVSRRLEKYDEWFDLINKRSETTEKEYLRKKYKSVGSSQLVFKKKAYTGFKRKDVNRV